MGVAFRQAWSESQWTVLMRYLTISTKLLDAIKHIRPDSCIVRATQSNLVKNVIFVFPRFAR